MKIYVGAGDRRETALEKLRVPMPPKIEIIVQDFVGFISKYASNISQGGMFIATDALHPAGTEIEFDVHLAEDKFSLIRGRGVVVWSRTEATGEDRPAGMGIRFSTLEGDSLALIKRMVENYVAEGGTPFALEREAPPGPATAPEAAAVPAPSTPHETDESESREAVRALGHSDRGLAPGMEPSSDLEGQEERARAPKPKLLGVEGKGSSAPAPVDRAQPLPGASAPGPVQPSRLLGWGAEAHSSPTGEPPPLEDPTLADLRAAGIVPVPAKTPTPRVPVASPEASDAVARESRLEPPGREETPSGEPDGPSLELDADGEMSLDLDDDDFSIEFDTTNSLESERQQSEAASPDVAEVTEEPAGAEVAPEPRSAASDEVDIAVEEEPAAMPDLSQTLGQGMVGAGTGFSEAIQLETEGVEAPEAEGEVPTVSDPATRDLPPTGDEVAGAEGGLWPESGAIAGPAGGLSAESSGITEPEVGPSLEGAGDITELEGDLSPEGGDFTELEVDLSLEGVGDITELEGGLSPEGGDFTELEVDLSLESAGDLGKPEDGDASALEELVAELQTAPEATSDVVEVGEQPSFDERTSAPVRSSDVEPIREVDEAPVAAPSESPAPGTHRLEPPPVDDLVLPEVERTRPYETRPGMRRARRAGQLRRWSILLVLLGGVGSGMFYVREKGVEFLLGPGSAFTPPSEPLAESEELTEIVPSTLLELMQEERPQVEIVELEATRQRQVRPLTLVENVTWQETDRTTILTLWGNGDFTPSSTAYVRLDGETSREVLQIRGTEEPYWAANLAIRTSAVDALRFGYRLRKPFNEVHLAIDLHRPQARVRRIELDGRRLRVYIR